MSGSYLGKGFVSRSGGSIAPLAQAGVVFFIFIFIFYEPFALATIYEQATSTDDKTTLGIVGKILVNTG